jgi:hypothetical protein
MSFVWQQQLVRITWMRRQICNHLRQVKHKPQPRQVQACTQSEITNLLIAVSLSQVLSHSIGIRWAE